MANRGARRSGQEGESLPSHDQPREALKFPTAKLLRIRSRLDRARELRVPAPMGAVTKRNTFTWQLSFIPSIAQVLYGQGIGGLLYTLQAVRDPVAWQRPDTEIGNRSSVGSRRPSNSNAQTMTVPEDG
jgi:hypothetical protein